MSAEFDDSSAETGLPSEFRVAVTEVLTSLGYCITAWEIDGVNVQGACGKGEQRIGLTHLHRRTRAVEESLWPPMIREFLDHVTGALELPKLPDDLTTIASQLRPRLGKPIACENTHPWKIPLPETGLEINLVIDYPHTMVFVTDDVVKKTGKAGEDLLDLALANLKANTPADFFEQVSDELDIYVGHTGDGYDSARALLVEDLLPESPAGFWVAIPSREELAVWPVSFAALERVHCIKLFAEENYREHAYPVTAEVFWLWHGTWYPFGIHVGEEVTLSPPDEFLAALKQLEGQTE